MNSPQQPPVYPPPPAPPKPKRALWILGIVGAFVIGLTAGNAGDTENGSTSARETVTVRVPAGATTSTTTETTAEAPVKAVGPATTMESGVYQVGVDVAAGQYKTAGPEGGIGCYWARLKNDSGAFEAIISNGNLEGQGSVTVNDGEFVELSGDCIWNRVG